MEPRGPSPGLSPSLEEVTRGSPGLEDELLAERLEDAGLAWLSGGRVPTLGEILACVPILRSRPISLDAAIDVALRGYLAKGLSLADAAGALLRECPDLEDAIEAHLALRSMLGSAAAPRLGASPPPDDLPRPFGPALRDGRYRYQLEEWIGSGAEGTVFRAMDRLLSADGRPLSAAVKFLHAWRDGAEQSVSDEAARAARVRHPAIAPLLDYGTCDGQPYLAYGFVDAVALDRWRARQLHVPQRRAAELVKQLAEAIQVAHNAGVVHRDLKPTNILIDKAGAPHITDFGLAAAIARGRGADGVGSLGFAAPEQLRGEAGCEDAMVDVYALGGVLYWLLTGLFPNGRSPEEVQAWLRRPNGLVAPDPRREAPETDTTLSSICRKALAPSGADRHQSAALLASDLASWLNHEPVLPFDRPAGKRVRLWVRRSPRMAAISGLALAAVLLSIGVAWRLDVARRVAAFESELRLSRVRAEEQERRIESTRSTLQSTLGAMRGLDADDANLSWMPVIAAFEALGADLGLGSSALRDDLSELRISVARNLLGEASGTPNRDSAEMTMWETALGYWLLEAGRVEEALGVLRENRERAQRVLAPGDPWQQKVTALCDIATILAEPDAPHAEARARLGTIKDALPPNLREIVEDVIADSTLAGGPGSPGAAQRRNGPDGAAPADGR